jgi:OmcA/MtrC family decaheme c-type cytochrome
MCVLCHAPDQTDFGHRPKDANGNVNLGATFDGLEERSVDFKTFIHRIHTGNRRGGSARLELSRPHVVSGSKLLDDVEFPGDLANCLLCHLEGTYSPDAIQADAAPTVANETPTILHQGTAAHVAGERARPPTTAACMGCHDTATALVHSSRYTVSGVEQCAQCHVKGAVKTVHGLK